MSQRERGAPVPPSAWTPQIPQNQDELLLQLELDSIPSVTTKKKDSCTRRFDDHQIKHLERMFEEEARPELHAKQELANKLGLLPRQVAIWFQNKRARSKSKQIEQDYNLLKASYQDLTSKFDSLKKENESLRIQVQRLRQLLTTGHPTEDINLTTTDMPRFVVLETCSHKLCKSVTQNYGEKADYLQEQRCALPEAQITDRCFTSAGDKCSFQTDDLLENQSCSNSQWWEL